jgi:hypothetical protein
MEVQTRRSPDIGELAAALAKAQAAYPEIPRNREVKVRTRAGAEYTFRYATLDTILAGIRKPNADNGLAVSQLIESTNGTAKLQTLLMHSSGQWLLSEAPIISAGGNQEFGSALAYMRRYTLSAIVNLASQEDDDANIAEGNHVEDVPATGGEQTATPPAGPRLASEKQRKMIYALSKEKGLDETAMKAMMDAQFGVTSSKELSIRDASTLIDYLQKIAKADPEPEAEDLEGVPF